MRIQIHGVLLGVALLLNASSGQETGKLLRVDGAAEPVPALKYRLIPNSATLVEGNAAPIYLRLVHELGNQSFAKAGAKANELLQANDKDFSEADAEKLLSAWTGRLQQIHYGTKRRRCEWNYTIMDEREDVVALAIPDAGAMRNWGRLLALKARLELAQGKHELAAKTIATGFAFSRHVGQGPFLVNRLVGIAIASVMADQLERMIGSENSPNMYWALASAPRPLIPLRGSLELEYRVGGLLVPELEQFETLSKDGEWEFLYRRFMKRFGNLSSLQLAFGPAEKDNADTVPQTKKAWAKVARGFLGSEPNWSQQQVQEMSDEQATVLYIVHAYRNVRDSVYKFTYLPYPDAFRQYGTLGEKIKEIRKKNPGLSPFVMLLPALGRAHLAEAKLQRRLEALRALEAVRMSITKGKLPKSVADLVVPMPHDPVTGLPFRYQASGRIGTLSAPDVEKAFADSKTKFFQSSDAMALQYRLSIRKESR